MNQDIEGYLRSVESQLSLPPERARAVLAELREHLRADSSERTAAGSDEAASARAAIAEMGDPDSMVRQLNHVHEPEGSLLRTVVAAEIALFGYSGLILGLQGGGGVSKLLRLLAEATGQIQMRPTGPMVLSNTWYGAYAAADFWLDQHRLAGQLLCMIPLAGVGLLAGYVARRRSWAYGLIPWGLMMGLRWMCMPANGGQGFDAVQHLMIPICAAFALAGGGQLGARASRWSARFRAPLLASVASVIGAICLAGIVWEALDRGILTTAGVLVAYAWILGLTVWMLLAGVRYHRSRTLPGHAG